MNFLSSKTWLTVLKGIQQVSEYVDMLNYISPSEQPVYRLGTSYIPPDPLRWTSNRGGHKLARTARPCPGLIVYVIVDAKSVGLDVVAITAGISILSSEVGMAAVLAAMGGL